MNIHNMLPKAEVYFYYPIGNTPPVCLTQDLPPEQDAHILLLGCGDARNVLFTCFSDNARKIDVTCCDIEPLIHARNVLLYTLFIEDETNRNVEQIWNIYHLWNIDGQSLELLESQAQKLLAVSESVDKWHSSVYGAFIRFCDERSLSAVRRCWEGFTSHGLSPSKKEDWLAQLQASIERAKTNRKEKRNNGPDMAGYRSTFPTHINEKSDGFKECLSKVTKEWWNCGMVPPDSSSLKPSHLNPAILYSPNPALTLQFGVSPIGGIPLSTVYCTISKESALYAEKKGTPAEYLMSCVKNHFAQWAIAFRRAFANGSIIRIFSGDALALCFALHNCHLTQSTSMNIFCDNWTSSPLVLHHSDYGPDSNAAPVNFDVIDTSNLADYLGPINLITLATQLLKHHVSSCFYLELLMLWDFSVLDRLPELFGVDIRAFSLFLGLVPPDFFTKVTNTVEDYPDMCNVATRSDGVSQIALRSRLRWRRYQASGNSPQLEVEAEELAKFLIQVYNTMFVQGDMNDPGTEMYKKNYRVYNCSSFALLLSILKINIISDWDEIMNKIYDSDSMFKTNLSFFHHNSDEDLSLNLHVFGVNSGLFTEPTRSNFSRTKLTSVLPDWKEDLPDQLCVTIRIPRAHLKTIFEKGTPIHYYMICTFETYNQFEGWRTESFASVQIAFGKWHDQTDQSAYPFIEEDCTHVSGSSDMYASVMVPTSMLTSMFLTSKKRVPKVKCGLKFSKLNAYEFRCKLGLDFTFYSCEITSKNIFISRFMPGMSGLPKFMVASNVQDKVTSAASVAPLSSDVDAASVTTNTNIAPLSSDVAVASVTTDTTVAPLSSDTAVSPLSSDVALATVTTDTTVAPLSSDTAVAAFSSDVAVASITTDTTVAPFSSDTAVSPLSSDITVVRLSCEGFKINSLIKRIAIDSKVAKSAVKVKFESPFMAVVGIAGLFERRLKFPVPVSISKFNVRVESSFVEIESPLFDPLEEDAPLFLFPCFLMKVPSGVVPTLWTSTRIDLDTMPSLDLNVRQELAWFHEYLQLTFSVREIHAISKKEQDVRTALKESLNLLFTRYASEKLKYFGLRKDSALHMLIFPSSLRLDLAINTVVLDCAIIPLTKTNLKDPLLIQFIQELHLNGSVLHINTNEAENLAWKAMMPALAERCRTWEHKPCCEYTQTNEVPLSTGLEDFSGLPVCSCGIGKFPANYLKDEMSRCSDFSHVLNHYATRVAISPIFAIQYIEDCDTAVLRDWICGTCGREERKDAQKPDQQGLLVCSRCKKVRYCSAQCQKYHWRNGHKQYCKTGKN